MSGESEVIHGDCLTELRGLKDRFALVYLDPPFFTNTTQRAVTRDGRNEYSYEDSWPSMESYLEYMKARLEAVLNVVTENASIVYHCDRRTSHHARLLLETLLGVDSFRSEIVWTYKRWSNSKKGLMPAHQTLFWFTVGDDYIFNQRFEGYSPTTNVDQLLQMRTRDSRNKSVYAYGDNGSVIPNGAKKGVPVSDVWDIPYLNPKAKERVGYPTQKPVALLSRVVEMFSNPEDYVLDPFCGSGTTLVATQLHGRTGVGIDLNQDAVALCRSRLQNPVITQSKVLEVGRESYRRSDDAWESYLIGLDVTPVHRNSSIDAVLENGHHGLPVLFRVQRPGESISALSISMAEAVEKKQAAAGFIVRNRNQRAAQGRLFNEVLCDRVYVVDSVGCQVHAALAALN
ncbi:site-specific DNA-methyltransferase [Lujinxingia sediminis]|uniref:Methyltransferase n=1 Tax=Lujinxingia sediminis TaxID=2480984 RepID=A0ABY0CUE1_9DELT|nr:DNA methyltransferase [Lujinxingia sediminis]RVU46681.1 site-specific DNA-methyltransferase [Lujinxingia sediminis]